MNSRCNAWNRPAPVVCVVAIEQLTPPPAGHDSPLLPAVMLSPNARNFVALSCGGLTTVTLKLHAADFLFASTAEHVTFVVPSGKLDPACGLQEMVTGAAPPLNAGFG
jgi:hypothetical protein